MKKTNYELNFHQKNKIIYKKKQKKPPLLELIILILPNYLHLPLHQITIYPLKSRRLKRKRKRKSRKERKDYRIYKLLKSPIIAHTKRIIFKNFLFD